MIGGKIQQRPDAGRDRRPQKGAPQRDLLLDRRREDSAKPERQRPEKGRAALVGVESFLRGPRDVLQLRFSLKSTSPRSKAVYPARKRLSPRVPEGFCDIGRSERAVQACFKVEGTLKSVTNIEVSYEKAEQRRPVGPCGGLSKLGPDGGPGTADEDRRQVDDLPRPFARPSRLPRDFPNSNVRFPGFHSGCCP